MPNTLSVHSAEVGWEWGGGGGGRRGRFNPERKKLPLYACLTIIVFQEMLFKMVIQKNSGYQTGADKQIPIFCIPDRSDIIVDNSKDTLYANLIIIRISIYTVTYIKDIYEYSFYFLTQRAYRGNGKLL